MPVEKTVKKPETASAAATTTATPAPFVPPKGTHQATVDSMGIEDLFQYYEYDSAQACDEAAGETGATVRLANLYMRQKGVLVDGRKDLQKSLETLTGFKMLMTTETKKNEDGTEEKVQVPAEKPAEWWSRFKKAALTGELKHPSIDGKGEAQLHASIRALAHKLGPYVCDPKKAVREAKEKKLAQSWLDAAKQIIARGPERVAFWKKVFTNGDEAVPTPTPFEPFDTVAPNGTSPESVAATAEQNITNLGWAIKAYDSKLSKARYV